MSRPQVSAISVSWVHGQVRIYRVAELDVMDAFTCHKDLRYEATELLAPNVRQDVYALHTGHGSSNRCQLSQTALQRRRTQPLLDSTRSVATMLRIALHIVVVLTIDTENRHHSFVNPFVAAGIWGISALREEI